MSIKENLKLYIWEEVLCGYGCGIAFTLAHNTNEARRLIRKKLITDGWTKHYKDKYLKPFEKRPHIICKPKVFYSEGGDS